MSDGESCVTVERIFVVVRLITSLSYVLVSLRPARGSSGVPCGWLVVIPGMKYAHDHPEGFSFVFVTSPTLILSQDVVNARYSSPGGGRYPFRGIIFMSCTLLCVPREALDKNSFSSLSPMDWFCGP